MYIATTTDNGVTWYAERPSITDNKKGQATITDPTHLSELNAALTAIKVDADFGGSDTFVRCTIQVKPASLVGSTTTTLEWTEASGHLRFMSTVKSVDVDVDDVSALSYSEVNI